MFIALRELVFARGRFALMSGVIALLTLLVVLLSGLTAGLAERSVAAVRSLAADRLAFSAPATGQSLSFNGSRIGSDQLAAWAAVDGVTGAQPLGVAATRVHTGSANDEQQIAVTAFGATPGSWIAPSALEPGTVVVGTGLTDEGVHVGDRVSVGGTDFTVSATIANGWFNHTPVVWMPLPDWQKLPAAAGAVATVVALRTASGADLDASVGGTVVRSLDGALSAVGSYSAENGSLTLMRVLLFAVTALVVGAFFTVWTLQRRADLAVLKAIGASDRYLVTDGLAQAIAVLAVGGAAGTGIAAALGGVAARFVPFAVTAGTTVVPLLLLVGIGLVGAAVAVRSITSVDPLTALGAAR